MSFQEDLKSLFHDDYKLGVEQSDTTKYVLIDPNKFDLDYIKKHGAANPDDVKIFRKMLDEQIPGFSSKFTDEQLLSEIPDYLTMGPFAFPAHLNEFNGEKICIINRIHDSIANKDTLAKGVALDHAKLIKHVLGDYDTWERAVAIHEKKHCEQVNTGRPLEKLIGETESDQEKHDWLNENGYEKVSRAHADYRALGASWSNPILGNDLAHSTSIFLNIKGDNPDGLKELHAADTYKLDLIDIKTKRVEAKYSKDFLDSLSTDESLDLAKKELRLALDEGAFKSDNPYKEKFTREFIESFEKDPGKLVDAEQNIINAEAGFNDFMLSKVQTKLAAGEVAKDIQFNDPARFSKLLEECRKEGQFKHENPYMERYTNAYVDAYRRQIIEAKPDPKHKTGPRASADNDDSTTRYAQTEKPDKTTTPAEPIAAAVATPSAYANMDVSQISDGSTLKVNQNDVVNSSTNLGGVSVPAYFASFADPSLANARLELQKTVEPLPLVLTNTQQSQYRSSATPA